MHWNSFEIPPKREDEELESRLLKFALFEGNHLIRIDDGYYDFVQQRFYYESDRFSGEHAITVNCTHWMYEEDYWKLLEELPKYNEERCY